MNAIGAVVDTKHGFGNRLKLAHDLALKPVARRARAHQGAIADTDRAARRGAASATTISRAFTNRYIGNGPVAAPIDGPANRKSVLVQSDDIDDEDLRTAVAPRVALRVAPSIPLGPARPGGWTE